LNLILVEMFLYIKTLFVSRPFFTGDYEDLDAVNLTLTGNFSGRYRSYRGVDIPELCPSGSYCPEGTAAHNQYLCPGGTFSNATGLWNETQCTPCTPGYFCLGEGG